MCPRLAQGLSLVMFCALSIAADAPNPTAKPSSPQSPSAVAAMDEYEKGMSAAEAAYRHAQLVAERKLTDKLKAALLIATKAGNLDEANRINEQVKAAAIRMDGLSAKPKPSVVEPEFTVFDVTSVKKPDGKIEKWSPPARIWLKRGGEAVQVSDGNQLKGKWTLKENRWTIIWPGWTDIFDTREGTKSFTGKGKIGELFGEVVGTSADGVEKPPF